MGQVQQQKRQTVLIVDPGIKVDENYLRESIMDPQAHIVAGFAPAMPTYQGKLSDKDIDGLIEFIKSLK